MMLVAGYFQIREAMPSPVWSYPLSYISLHTFAVQVSNLCSSWVDNGHDQARMHVNKQCCMQGLVENEYVGTSFAVGASRTIPGVQAVRGSYDISSSPGAKWVNLLVLLLMAVGYRVVLYVLLRLDVRGHVRLGRRSSCWPRMNAGASAK